MTCVSDKLTPSRDSCVFRERFRVIPRAHCGEIAFIAAPQSPCIHAQLSRSLHPSFFATMTYSIHAGGISEPAPERKGSLYLCGVDPETAKKQGEEHAWYDFFEQAVSTDRQGNIDTETTGCVHPASRTSGADTAFRPSVKNMAPRKANWTQSETNTQKEHRK